LELPPQFEHAGCARGPCPLLSNGELLAEHVFAFYVRYCGRFAKFAHHPCSTAERAAAHPEHWPLQA
jgi:hypothetical protein